MSIAVAFDVLGTCFSFDTVIQFHSAQRDYTYLSLTSSYAPISSVLNATLPRALSIHFDNPPSSEQFEASSAEVKAILSALKELTPQPGLKDAFTLLHGKGAKIYLVTNGGLAMTTHYIRTADLEGLVDKVMSCDDVPRGGSGSEKGVAKPDPRVYDFTMDKIKEETGAKDIWFCAAHAWDLVGAKRAGFRTAYSVHEERAHPLEPDIFGVMGAEVVGKGLVETVESILAL